MAALKSVSKLLLKGESRLLLKCRLKLDSFDISVYLVLIKMLQITNKRGKLFCSLKSR